MALRAVRNHPAFESAPNVLRRRDRLKMVWANAQRRAAQVVDDKSGRNLADKQLVGDTMCRTTAESSVYPMLAGPEPAAVRLLDSRPESLFVVNSHVRILGRKLDAAAGIEKPRLPM